MNANAAFPPGLGGFPPFVMPPTLGPAEQKLFEQISNAQLNNNNLPTNTLNTTFAPLVLPPPPTSTSSSNSGHSPNSASSANGVSPADNPERNTPEYLQQLLKDKRAVQELGPTIFQHVDRILDDEIFRVRLQLFHISLTNLVEPMEIPDTNNSPTVTLTEKVYIPTKEHPEFNFVGRLLGPRGTTAKFLEHVLETKIMVRGKGSMREKRLEDQYRGKPHWEHLKDELHVLLTVETTQNRAEQVLKRACQAIKKFLEVIPDGDDPWKKLQLMELATYNNDRFQMNGAKILPSMPGLPGMPTMPGLGLSGMPANPNASSLATGVPFQAPRLFPALQTVPNLRTANPAGAPILLGPPRLQNTSVATSAASTPALLNGGQAVMSSPADTPPIFPMTYDYSAYAAALSPIAFDYPGLTGADASVAGAMVKQRKNLSVREHPYQRVGLP